jgi:broad specificity phosphatase PhoE
VKQITFIRHAKVDMDSGKPIYAKELLAWEEAYNSAPIITDPLPEDALVGGIKRADYVVSSRLRRAIDSLELLEIEIDEKNRLFNEAAIPALGGRLFKLKPAHWLALFRLLSLIGVGRWARTLRETKADARKAAERLSELSAQHDHIVLMGHGVMNWLIRKELKREGWGSEGREVHGNWGSTVLFCES